MGKGHENAEHPKDQKIVDDFAAYIRSQMLPGERFGIFTIRDGVAHRPSPEAHAKGLNDGRQPGTT